MDCGAEWAKVDLHLHTPGVDTFRLLPGVSPDNEEDRERIIDEYISKLMSANIKIVAITDYNGIRKEWFERIKEKAKEKYIIILPGVELSIGGGVGGKYGLHLLLIFEEDVNVDELSSFLWNFDEEYPTSKPTNRDLKLKKSLKEFIDEVRDKYNCLVVFAHPDNSKGFMKSYSPKEAVNLLKSIKPDAIEYISESSKNRLLDTGELDKDFFRRIAIIENSDPKSLDEIGNKVRDGRVRATYVKLSDFSLDALKLALHDPEVRVRLYNPPNMLHTRISKIKIEGTNFLKDIEIVFNPEMNTLVGGRGVGKSAVIESIRYCLDLEIYSDKSFREEFVKNVVGSGGKISIEIEKFYGDTKQKFIVERVIGKEPEVFSETGEKLDLSPRGIFDKSIPIVIGQKELYFLAEDRNFQLKLIDELAGEDVKKKLMGIYEFVKKLNENKQKILEFEEKINQKIDYEQQLKNIKSKIKIYKELGVAEKLDRHTKVIEDDELVKSKLKDFDEVLSNIENVLEESSKKFEKIYSSLRSGKSEGKDILSEIADVIAGAKDIIEKSSILQDLKANREEIKEILSRWKSLKDRVENEIRETIKQLGERGLQPEKLEDLTRKKAKLQNMINNLKDVDKKLDELKRKREEIKRKLKDARYELFRIRYESLERINEILDGKLKIEVEFEGNRDNFRDELKKLLKGSRIRDCALDSIVYSDKAIDGLLLSEYVKEGWEKLRDEFDLTDMMAQKLCEYLKKKIYDLETLFPDDLIEIKLKVGDDYKSLGELSAGQKATALLLLLFAQEGRITILDQPEEDLDNRFIYENIVKILRKLKGKRQLIIATHNANIPVLGDAEQIIVFEVQNGCCNVIDRGSIDKKTISSHVKEIMEGGKEAFRRRAEKYGGIT